MKHTVIGTIVKELIFEKDGQNRISKVKLTAWLEAAVLVATHFGAVSIESAKVVATAIALIVGVPGIRDVVPKQK